MDPNPTKKTELVGSQLSVCVKAYVKEFHTTGLSWNKEGGNALSLAASKDLEAVPVAAGGPPPHPTPPPPPTPI